MQSVHSTYRGARNALIRQKRKYESYGIQCVVNDDFLVISGVPWRAFTKIYYKIERDNLYGIRAQNKVYRLIRTNGYLIDQDKPYRFDPLGWFTSPYVAKGTKEWQMMRYIINSRDDIIGYENDLEIGILGSYGLSNINPTLFIREYKLLK